MKKNVLLKKHFSCQVWQTSRVAKLFLLVFAVFCTNAIFGQDATSLDFDGANDYVSCGNIMPSTYTKEAWFLVSDLSLNNNLISGGSVDGQHALYPGAVNGNRLSSGHNGNWTAVQDPTPIVANTWYHVALTYDAATTTMKLYTNGVLVSTNTNVSPFTGGNALRIGAFDNGSNLLGGKMDEVRIWNRVLTQTEIQSNMYCELASGQTGLLAYYKFNQGVAAGTNTGINTLTDSSGNNNTGTLTNFALMGTTSNWTADQETKSSAETVTASCSYLWTENGSVYTESGTFTNTVNCFTKTLNLTITSPSAPIINNDVPGGRTLCSKNNPTIATINNFVTGSDLRWYADATSTEVLDPVTEITLIGTNVSYFVSQTNDGCESPRLQYDAFVNISLEPIASDQTFCAGTNPTVANLVATLNGNGTNLKWYLSETSSIVLSPSRALRAGTTNYYVSQEGYPCGEGTRKKVTVTYGTKNTTIYNCGPYYWPISGTTYFESGDKTFNDGCVTYTLTLVIDPVSVPEIVAQFRQDGATLADVTVLGGQNIKWYADANGTAVLPNDTTLETKTYYATQSQTSYDTGDICESQRVAVNITVGEIPEGYVYIPDSRFEQRIIDLELDNTIDSLVLESNINTLTDLNLAGAGIRDLTGIKSFSSLKNLDLIYNYIDNLDLSYMTSLESVGSYGNYSKTIELNGLSNLKELNLGNSALTEINLTGLTALEKLEISSPGITNLDLTGLTNLTDLNCRYTNITGLNLKNKPNLVNMNAAQIKTLTCIMVDDVDDADAKTTVGNWQKDATANYSSGTTNTTVVDNACGSYTWAVNGQTYTTFEGTNTYTLTSGCTSEVLVLSFKPTIISYTVNECASYTWAESGETYTKSGVYTVLKKDCITEELILTIKMPALQTTTYTLCGPATADNLFVSQSNGSVNFYTTETGSDRVTGAIAEGTHTFYVSQTEMQFNWERSKNNKSAALCESVRVPIEYIVRPTIDNTVVFENGTITVANVVSGDTYSWYDNTAGEYIAGETNSSFTPSVGGLYMANIRRNSETPGDYCWRFSEVVDTKTLSTIDFDATTVLSVYPNPSSDVFFIESKASGTITVNDLKGKTIQTQKINSGTSPLDMSKAATGVYLLKVTTDNNQSKTVKLIKK